jgi:hypothetical protein
MLPSDVKERKTASVIASAQQTTIDGHLIELPAAPAVLQYSTAVFREATVEWLISTSQVCACTVSVVLTLMRLPANSGY